MTRATGPRTVLLDLDGTLLDHDEASQSALLAALDESDLPRQTDVEVPLARWRDLEARHFQRYLDGELTFQEQRVERTREFLASYGVRDRDERALLEWFDRYRTRYEDAWRVFDDVHPFLQAVAALDDPPTLAVVTNGDHDQQASKLARVGIDGIALHTSSELGARKPDPAAFHRVCDVLRIRPADAWFVGDNREVDAEGAERAGLHGIWLDRGGGTAQRGRPSRADSLTDVTDWMRAEQ